MITRLLSLLFLALPLALPAQQESDLTPRLWFVGGGINASQGQTTDLSNPASGNASYWLNSSVYVGRALNARWDMGGVLSFNAQGQVNSGGTTASNWSERSLGPAVFARYTSATRAGFQGVLQPQVGFEMNSLQNDGFLLRRSNGYLFRSQVSAGLLYEVNDRLRLLLRLASLGHHFGRTDSTFTRTRTSGFHFNSALSSIGLGLEWKW